MESRRIAVVQLLEGMAEISSSNPCDQLRVIFTHVRGMMPQRFIPKEPEEPEEPGEPGTGCATPVTHTIAQVQGKVIALIRRI